MEFYLLDNQGRCQHSATAGQSARFWRSGWAYDYNTVIVQSETPRAMSYGRFQVPTNARVLVRCYSTTETSFQSPQEQEIIHFRKQTNEERVAAAPRSTVSQLSSLTIYQERRIDRKNEDLLL